MTITTRSEKHLKTTKFFFKYLFISSVLIVFLSCSDDDDGTITSSETTIDLVTGLIIRQSDFDPGIRLGNPNTRMPLSLSSTSIIAYPNPVTSLLVISLSQTNDVITDVWLVRANTQQIFRDTDFDTLLTENTYTVEEIAQSSIQEFSGLSNNQVNLNLEDLHTGYYRIFIKTEESLYWDNIYVDNEGVNIDEFIDSWE